MQNLVSLVYCLFCRSAAAMKCNVFFMLICFRNRTVLHSIASEQYSTVSRRSLMVSSIAIQAEGREFEPRLEFSVCEIYFHVCNNRHGTWASLREKACAQLWELYRLNYDQHSFIYLPAPNFKIQYFFHRHNMVIFDLSCLRLQKLRQLRFDYLY